MSAIVLGVDSPIGLTVVRELGRHGVAVHAVGRSVNAIGLASRFAQSRIVRPGGPLGDWLPATIASTGARALLAVSESDLIELAALPQEIGGCRILTPREPQLAAVLDKQATLASAAELGIDVPATWQPAADEDHASIATELEYPVVLKWRDPSAVAKQLDAAGIAFLKTEFARDPAQLGAVLMRYDQLGRWPMVQTYCAGQGLGQMLYMANGCATLRFQHRRLHEWPPEGGVSSLCRAEPLDRHAAQFERSEALLATLDWSGPAMVEYRWDARSGKYWLMEINGRFWGSLPLASAAGAHFAWEAYRRQVLGQRDPAPTPSSDLAARYLIPELRRLHRVLVQPGRIADPFFKPTPLADLADFGARTLAPRTRHYVWQWSDPAPLFRDAWSVIVKSLRVR